jgi:hypothetical protein
MRYIWIDR